MRDHLPLPILTYLDGVLVGEEVDDLERVRDNADGEELLAVVASLHHQAREEGDVCLRMGTITRTSTHLSTNRSTMGI